MLLVGGRIVWTAAGARERCN